MFKANEAYWDRVARIILSIILLVLGWSGIVTAGWGIFFKIIEDVSLLTGLTSYCPIYTILEFGTKKVG